MTNRDPFWIAMRDVAQCSAHAAAFIVFRHEPLLISLAPDHQ
jgi:hypothetical protein